MDCKLRLGNGPFFQMLLIGRTIEFLKDYPISGVKILFLSKKGKV